jgi:hypothetical protein
MTVAQKLRRKTKITPTTSAIVSSRVNCTSSTEARMVWVRSLRMPTLMAAGNVAVRRGSCALMLSTVSMTLAPGCLNTTRKMPRLPLVQPACFSVLGTGDRLSDVADAQRRTVAIGDDDVVPVVGRGELVVGVDGVAVAAAVDAALRVVDRGEGELRAHVLQRQALGHELRRIDLDPHGGFCWPPMKTWATPEIWLIRWASWTSTASSTSISGMLSEVAESSRIGESAGLTLR